MHENIKTKVGELRPSQVLFSFGVGAMIDLPNMSVMVMGLDDWDLRSMPAISEERLLVAVRRQLGDQVKQLRFPPFPQENTGQAYSPFNEQNSIGIPVAPFPRWVRCPLCHLLAPLHQGVFKLIRYPFQRARYVHENCPKGKEPSVLPVRFLTACEQGHLDDFPWHAYVHAGLPCEGSVLRLREWGVSGSVSEVEVRCETCGAKRRMRDAFMGGEQSVLPSCRGRRPHLRDYQENECEEPQKTILLGASNTWFPVTLSSLYIPAANVRLNQLVEEHWANLREIASLDVLNAFAQIPMFQPVLHALSGFTNEQIWNAIQEKQQASETENEEEAKSLKIPEWETFTHPDSVRNSDEFSLKRTEVPPDYAWAIEQVILVERLREVRALIGFTRIDSPGNFDDLEGIPKDRRVPLSRQKPQWVPASEVRGEGIFIQFREAVLEEWRQQVQRLEQVFREAHRRWRQARKIEPPEDGFPGIRYVLLHSFAHALMRQIALECGYTAASLRERTYSLPPEHEDDEPMAGVLIYTGAADSEGTLGGLVNLGTPETLGRHIDHALEQMRLCASDPLCEEHNPLQDGSPSLHGAACHACLFAPETSCERGNKYLDRRTLVRTFGDSQLSFFDRER